MKPPTRTSRKLLVALLLTAALGGGALQAQAWQQRLVTVNGVLLNPQQLAALDRMVGHVANGHYWYDANSGYWGYMGNPYPQGRLTGNGGGGGGNYLNRGQFGSTMGDGNGCFAYNDPETGASVMSGC